jgi:aryl-alcohol dehydrogenase-like predicted oxidoreductase
MYFKEEDWAVLDALLEVAKDVDRRPAQVALAWLLSVPGVDAPIVGTTKLEQLEELVEAVDLKLGDEHVLKLEAAYRPHPILGHKQRTPRELRRK